MAGRQQILRAATRAAAGPRLTRSSIQTSLPSTTRSITTSTPRSVTPSKGRRNKNDPFHDSSSATLGTPGYDHEGSQARTDNTIVVEYPDDQQDFPTEPVLQGRGGPHLKRTLPTFSLEGRVAVVTGGARGLGLVMAQSLVASGADVAIVDLNSTLDISAAQAMLTITRGRGRVLRKSNRRPIQERQPQCRILRPKEVCLGQERGCLPCAQRYSPPL